ncbi:MAG: HIT family protein [Kiritimatiellae bacterium]|nr:HIT family protein [Kiritimatiellia bacterium]
MNNDCIFCKICAGELPATKVYEDQDVIAFMDIAPVSKGHTLVIPKEHSDPITGTSDETLAKLIAVAKKMVEAQIRGLDADGVNVAQANGKAAGQMIPHIHFHIIPRYNSDENTKNWIPIKYETMDEVREFANKIKNSIRNI